MLIAPAPPPFGGMANQANLLRTFLEKEKNKVLFIPTNQSPRFFSETLWSLPVLRTCGKLFMYMIGILKSIKHCSTMHILACSHLYFYLNVIPAIMIGRFLKKTVVVNYRGGEADVFFNGFAGNFLKVFHLANSVVVPSGYLKRVFNKFGYKANVIPNIAEILRFEFLLPDYTDQVSFVCTRNFEAYYDIETLVKAFNLVRKELSRTSLTLIGEGNLKQGILDYVEEKGLSGCVFFSGKVNPEDMPAHLEKHDIYVNSSVVDNYPISLLEAFSSGLPVVSTAAGGIPDMVEHGKTGILVPNKDHKTLAKEMIRVAMDLNLGRTLAKNAKKFADEHSWEKIWPKLKAEYRWLN